MALLPLSKDSLNPEKAGQVLTRLQDIPALRQLGSLLLVAAAIALGLIVFFWSQKPAYAPLYSGLDAKASAEAADLLRTAGIPFELDPVTGAIRVPEQNLHNARLKLAGAGLAESGRLGFELMERDPGFGVSQFVESARYQHALETELVRTIGTLRPVRDARVHLAIPKPSAFTRQREAASASVVLDLRPGLTLERNQVDAIVHLVASSIPDLAPERVTVVDQSGRMLTLADPDSDAALNAAQFEQVRRQENAFSQRIRELLEPLAGPGRINAEVAVDMDFAVTEEAREIFTPDPAKLRSEQTSESVNNASVPQGIPGATSNTPPAADAAATGAGDAVATVPTQTARSATRNFELDRTLQHIRQPAGRIRRVTAAVLVDHVPRADAEGKVEQRALSAEELAHVEALVKQAIGFDGERGDSVSVMNAPFVREQMGDVGADAPLWENPWLRDGLRPLLGAIAVLALLFGVLRPTLRQLAGSRPPPPVLAGPEFDVTLVDGAEPAALSGQSVPAQPRSLGSNSYEDRLRQAREAVNGDAKRVAQVVRDWVNTDG